MIVGYGFGDEHINAVIAESALAAFRAKVLALAQKYRTELLPNA
jgi:hypothetical protein